MGQDPARRAEVRGRSLGAHQRPSAVPEGDRPQPTSVIYPACVPWSMAQQSRARASELGMTGPCRGIVLARDLKGSSAKFRVEALPPHLVRTVQKNTLHNVFFIGIAASSRCGNNTVAASDAPTVIPRNKQTFTWTFAPPILPATTSYRKNTPSWQG
jgi:hypothetical protein